MASRSEVVERLRRIDRLIQGDVGSKKGKRWARRRTRPFSFPPGLFSFPRADSHVFTLLPSFLRHLPPTSTFFSLPRSPPPTCLTLLSRRPSFPTRRSQPPSLLDLLSLLLDLDLPPSSTRSTVVSQTSSGQETRLRSTTSSTGLRLSTLASEETLDPVPDEPLKLGGW